MKQSAEHKLSWSEGENLIKSFTTCQGNAGGGKEQNQV